ncbi:hypothetical protein SMD20_39695 [Nonomuraea sp. LP-02]|uniref:hypothetical protein n=1 Tax=Nonomuraea sp. LP-02 TaxID=3097960 RepID=UPI002E33F4DC|nr:hypothetical protein [Nonomuraea sp. LP-02]MED7930406.1 hypothetical protein [Nonomuraea sp. LP-02]
MTNAPVLGLHDSLLTGTLDTKINAWRQAGHLVEASKIDSEEVAHLLGRFVGETAARAFAERAPGDAYRVDMIMKHDPRRPGLAVRRPDPFRSTGRRALRW